MSSCYWADCPHGSDCVHARYRYVLPDWARPDLHQPVGTGDGARRRRTGRFLTDDGRLLAGAPYVSLVAGVGADTVRKHCEPVAADSGNSHAFLYDVSAALVTLAKVKRGGTK